MRAAAWHPVTAPSMEPLTVDELKGHLRISANDEDALIEAYALAARSWCEEYLGRALITQTWQAWYGAWPRDGVLDLPRPPLQSVTWVRWTDEAGVQQTLSTAVYRVVTASEPGRIVLAPGAGWPSETLDAGLPIVVQFVCGYGAAEAVPAGAMQAMRWLVGHMMENREAVTMAALSPQQVPMTARWALDPHRFRYG